MKTESNYAGYDGKLWFVGVVEDRRDPKKLGRLKVRILGMHTELKQFIPTCEIFWSYVYQSITKNVGHNGLGNSPTGPAEGCWVGGYMQDNDSRQAPIITYVIHGIPEEPPIPSIGFYDPGKPFHEIDKAPRKIRIRYYPNDGTGAQNTNESLASLYPRILHPWGCIVNESDVNRLCRAEMVDDTIMGVRKRQRDVHVPIAFVHPTPVRKWNEPLPGSQLSDGESRYPYVHTYESESGHVVEIDDTPNKERIHIWHRSGTYLEIGSGQEEDPGLHGNMTLRCVGKRFEVTMEQSYSHFQNTMNVTVDGETNIYCRSNANLQVDGDLNVHVGGNLNEKVKGDYNVDVNGSYNLRVGGSIQESAGGPFHLASGAIISGDAPVIHWNSGMFDVQPPIVPPFPDPLDVWTEKRNESDKDPVKETKPDVIPNQSNQQDC